MLLNPTAVAYTKFKFSIVLKSVSELNNDHLLHARHKYALHEISSKHVAAQSSMVTMPNRILLESPLNLASKLLELNRFFNANNYLTLISFYQFVILEKGLTNQ